MIRLSLSCRRHVLIPFQPETGFQRCSIANAKSTRSAREYVLPGHAYFDIDLFDKEHERQLETNRRLWIVDGCFFKDSGSNHRVGVGPFMWPFYAT